MEARIRQRREESRVMWASKRKGARGADLDTRRKITEEKLIPMSSRMKTTLVLAAGFVGLLVYKFVSFA